MTQTAKTFHRYRLLRRIARGGMAEVFLALLRGPAGFEKRVALKKILPVYAGMEEFGVLFRDEARLSALLEHCCIVQTYEFGLYEGEHFMAMEYVDGPDLEELLDRCRRRGILLPVDVVLHIVHELTRALEYAHARSEDGRSFEIIHRDVSPPNVLIGVHGEIKLTDFGVAKAADRESETRPGVLRGKYAYMSPEQVRQGDIDHRSDIFSIGIVLYEALTGVNPFEGTTDFQTMEAVEKAEIEPAGFLRPDTPTELDRILLACLEPDPDLRYQSASDLRRDLAEVIRSLRGDGPDGLVSFLKDVFPERGPDPSHGPAADLGVPAWEAFAHRLAAMAVPMPAGVRREGRPAAGGQLVVGSDDPGADTANDEPDRSRRPRSVPQRLVDTLPDAEPAPPFEEETAAPWSEGEPMRPTDEWVDEDDSPDRILTQPGVLMRAFGASTQLGPAYAAPPTDSLLPGPQVGAPVRGLDDVPDEMLQGVSELTDGGVPVFNEWDFGAAPTDDPAHQVSLDLDDDPRLGPPPREQAPTAKPAADRPGAEPPRQITQASGVSARFAIGSNLDAVAAPPRPASAPGRLRPPGRPRLHPVSRPHIEQLSPPVTPLELVDPEEPLVGGRSMSTPEARAHLSVVRDGDAPSGSAEVPAAAPPSAPRPRWAALVWAAVAVLAPLGALSTVRWLDEVQAAAKAPRIAAPSPRTAPDTPLPKRRVEPLPPSRPQDPKSP